MPDPIRSNPPVCRHQLSRKDDVAHLQSGIQLAGGAGKDQDRGAPSTEVGFQRRSRSVHSQAGHQVSAPGPQPLPEDLRLLLHGTGNDAISHVLKPLEKVIHGDTERVDDLLHGFD